LIVPVFRSPHSAAYTARGVANGVFWGLTPTIGLQTFAILATWFVGRRLFRRDSSLLQGLVWAWLNNPVTVVPMYYLFYVTGLWLTGEPGVAVDYHAFSIDNLTLGALGLPLVVGCLPYATVGSAIGYRWAMTVVTRRKERLARRRAALE
jgi:uncharacterized protein (DUF2062 family)